MTTAGDALKLATADEDRLTPESAVSAGETDKREPIVAAVSAVVISLADGKPLAVDAPPAPEAPAPTLLPTGSVDDLPEESPLEPAADGSVADGHGGEDASASREAQAEDPTRDEPVGEEPVGEEPVGEEPVGEEPPREELPQEELPQDEPAGEERASEEAPPRPAGPLFVVPAAEEENAPAPLLADIVRPGGARVRASANPLLAAAGAAITQARRLSETTDAPSDPEALGFELSRVLAEFEVTATQAGLSAGTVQVGRFALAATLDDLLRARPWAGSCGWLRQGLAAAGPERFFDLMRAMLKNPARHRHALELFYVCLSLGFEGRFRDRSQGGHELSRIRDQLYRVLRRLGEAPERALSPSPPKAAPAAYRPPPRFVSPTGIVFWLMAVAMLCYFPAAWWLESQAAALSARMAGMISEQSVATARPAPLPPPAGPELAARVTEALAPDIRAAAVEVMAGADGALVVRLSGGAVFPAGSDVVRAFYRAVIDRVGLALTREKGRVLVVAHTDAWALATEKFPTARALTEARAEAVRALLEKRLGGLRLSAEGRGDSEPIDSNDSPGGRAANRRVDIRLYP